MSFWEGVVGWYWKHRRVAHYLGCRLTKCPAPCMCLDTGRTFWEGCFHLGNASHTVQYGTVFALTSPRDGESLVKMEVSEFPGEMKVQVCTLQLSVLKAIYYTDHTICACLGSKVWLALGKDILFSSFYLTSKKKTYVRKLFTFEPFSSICILALLSSLYAFPVSFIRNQVFASCYVVICFTKSMIKV